MNVIFHKKFLQSYDHTPAGESGRLEPTLKKFKANPNYTLIKPKKTSIVEIKRAHTDNHFDNVKKGQNGINKRTYELAQLAAGGAILCAELAKEKKSAFGLIRPPGHHASSNSCWGFCYFNNIAISLLHLRATSNIKKAFILDFDLHTGDGNINILQSYGSDYEILNPSSSNEESYLEIISDALKNAKKCDIIVASAGFDQGIKDWGGLLTPESYFKIGVLMKKFSEKKCKGRRYALLEGGYNFLSMAENIENFCLGFD